MRGNGARIVSGVLVTASIGVIACGSSGDPDVHTPPANTTLDAGPSGPELVVEAGLPPLPSCPSGPTLSVLPLDPAVTSGITPLGGLNPPQHTLPTGHTYVVVKPGNAPVEIRIPGDGWITAITSTQAAGLPMEYSVTFQPCREQAYYWNHLKGVTDAFKAVLDPSKAPCSTDANAYTRCTSEGRIEVKAGAVLALAPVDPQWNIHAFDFGARDSRLAPAQFVNPARIGDPARDGLDGLHVLCPFASLPDDLRAQALALMGNGFKEPPVRRTGVPVCGTTMQDVPDTAAGNWFTYDPDGQLPKEDKAIALVTDASTGTLGAISIGGPSNVGVGAYVFEPQASGMVNRPFSSVTAGSGVHCYDTLSDLQGNAVAGRVLVEATADKKLRIERQDGTCGAGPWSFTTDVAELRR